MIFKPSRKSAHRLLHTLVFSSVLALDGCATGSAAASGEIDDPPQAAPLVERAPAPSSTLAPLQLTALSSGGSGGSSYEPASTMTEVSSTDRAAESPDDLRYCERGWPTTKAGNGNTFSDCHTVTRDDGTERVECIDQEGPCVHP